MVLPIPSGTEYLGADINASPQLDSPTLDGEIIFNGVTAPQVDMSTWTFVSDPNPAVIVVTGGTDTEFVVAPSQVGNVVVQVRDNWTPQNYVDDGGGLMAWFDADDADLTNGQLQWASKVGSLALSSTDTTWTKTSRESILNPLGNPNWEFSSILTGVKAIFLVIAYTGTQFTRFVATNSSNFPLAGNGSQLQASSGSPDFAIAKNGDDLTGYAASQPISWASPTNTTGPDLLWIAVDPLSSWNWGLIDVRNNQQLEVRALLAFDELPAIADRERVEGWAARLSTGTPDLTAKLSAIHPYKNDAPQSLGGSSAGAIVTPLTAVSFTNIPVVGTDFYIYNADNNAELASLTSTLSEHSLPYDNSGVSNIRVQIIFPAGTFEELNLNFAVGDVPVNVGAIADAESNYRNP